MSRPRFHLARVVLGASLTITVILSIGLAAFIAWAVAPLLPMNGYGASALWLGITTYLLWVLDISLKGLRK